MGCQDRNTDGCSQNSPDFFIGNVRYYLKHGKRKHQVIKLKSGFLSQLETSLWAEMNLGCGLIEVRESKFMK